jgi:flagellar biosynthesis protein FliQ
MNEVQFVLTLGQKAMEVMLLIAAPLLLTTLVVGLAISIFQAATQINEMTLSFIPKLLALFATLLVAGPWILTTLMEYTQQLFASIPSAVH